MPYREPAAMPPVKSLVLHPRRTPSTGMLAFGSTVFGIAATVGSISGVRDNHAFYAVILGVGAILCSYGLGFALRAWFRALLVTVSPRGEVTIAWQEHERRFPLDAVRGVRVVSFAAATSHVIIDLAQPHAAIALDALATADDLQPLSARLRGFLLHA